VAVALATLAILLALAVWFKALGPVGKEVDRLLGDLIGTVRYLLPVLLVGVVALLLITREHVEPARLWVGGALGLLALCGLAGLTRGNPSFRATPTALGRSGGIVGALIGHSLSRAIGTAGAAILLVAVLVVAVIVATGIPIRDALGGIGRGARRTGSLAVSWWGGSSMRARSAERPPEPVLTEVSVPSTFAPVPEEPEMLAASSEALALDEVPADLIEPPPAKRTTKARRAMVAAGEWKLPPAKLLKTSSALQADRRLVEQAGEDLVAALAAHGVVTTLIGSTVGPTVTRYELELGPGVKVARVTGLNKDIAYAMASADVRILAPIPGRHAIGVEVPNRQRQLVTLGDLLVSKEAAEAEHPLSVALGRDIAGRTVMQNLAEFPHVLISGATGAGKSSAINSLITSLLMRTTPDQVRLILVDPKRVELGQYNDLPHLLTPVVVDPKQAANALSWAVREMERRYDLLAAHHVRDITSYHEARAAGKLASVGRPDDAKAIAQIAERARSAASGVPFDAELAVESDEVADEVAEFDPLPFIVIVVDELNDLMMVAARDVEESVVRIAQMARAVGIHLVLATQRPSVDVITGVIKANVPSRMAFSVSSLADSRVILDQPGAERLVGKGDMLLLTASSNVARRIQAPWVSEEEVRDVASFWRAQGGQSEQVVAISELDGGSSVVTTGPGDDDDELLIQARRIVIDSQLGSTSMLQRKLRVGFARAGRLMDLLEQEGVVGPSTGSKAREVLIAKDESTGSF
jgi:S-DNA-T family DNA segregation ATPase FtsK/SpoIIIE